MELPQIGSDQFKEALEGGTTAKIIAGILGVGIVAILLWAMTQSGDTHPTRFKDEAAKKEYERAQVKNNLYKPDAPQVKDYSLEEFKKKNPGVYEQVMSAVGHVGTSTEGIHTQL